MTITTRDQLISALGNNSSRLLIDKASLSNAAAGQYHSLWRATGQPGQGAVPTTAAVCAHGLPGSFAFNQQTAPATSYLGWLTATGANAAQTLEIHDRLMHMGGLLGNVATAQTVNLDVHSNLASNNLSARKGAADYSDISWWLEWYTDTGSTAVTVTVAVTYNDGSSGNLTAISLAATRRASFMVPLNRSIPAASSGLFIRDIDSLTLSATTGTGGNFGATATRQRAVMPILVANRNEIMDWALLGMPEIHNDSCLMLVQFASATSTGIVRGQGKVAHG